MLSCDIALLSPLSGGVESLQCLLQDGTSCPTNLCPNSTVLYTCDIPPLSSQLGFSVWSFSGTAANCSMNKIYLLQPVTVGCFNQLRICGQCTASLSPPCNMTTLSMRITQDLNGTIIHCLNFNAVNSSTVDLGSTTISLATSKCANQYFILEGWRKNYADVSIFAIP